MGTKSEERQESTVLTRQTILSCHCSFSKVLTTITSQHRGAPRARFLLSWLHLTIVTSFVAEQQNPERLRTRSASSTRLGRRRKEKKMDSKPTRWLPAALLGSGHAHRWLQSPRRDLRARGSASTADFQHFCLSHD